MTPAYSAIGVQALFVAEVTWTREIRTRCKRSLPTVVTDRERRREAGTTSTQSTALASIHPPHSPKTTTTTTTSQKAKKRKTRASDPTSIPQKAARKKKHTPQLTKKDREKKSATNHSPHNLRLPLPVHASHLATSSALGSPAIGTRPRLDPEPKKAAGPPSPLAPRPRLLPANHDDLEQPAGRDGGRQAPQRREENVAQVVVLGLDGGVVGAQLEGDGEAVEVEEGVAEGEGPGEVVVAGGEGGGEVEGAEGVVVARGEGGGEAGEGGGGAEVEGVGVIEVGDGFGVAGVTSFSFLDWWFELDGGRLRRTLDGRSGAARGGACPCAVARSWLLFLVAGRSCGCCIATGIDRMRACGPIVRCA